MRQKPAQAPAANLLLCLRVLLRGVVLARFVMRVFAALMMRTVM